MKSLQINFKLAYCQLNLGNKLQGNFNQNNKPFVHEHAYDNAVCEIAAILSGENS